MKRELKVVNLFGGPGTGKSTTAASLFAEMKRRGMNVELVTEYAKDVVWERCHNVLADQVYIMANQNRRLERLVGHGLDLVITDSPLILGAMYTPEGYYDGFEPFLAEVFKSYNNFNVYLHRSTVYNALGRNQTAEEAAELDNTCRDLASRNDIHFDYSVDLTRGEWHNDLLQEILDWTSK